MIFRGDVIRSIQNRLMRAVCAGYSVLFSGLDQPGALSAIGSHYDDFFDSFLGLLVEVLAAPFLVEA
jgi:hypothetical protein